MIFFYLSQSYVQDFIITITSSALFSAVHYASSLLFFFPLGNQQVSHNHIYNYESLDYRRINLCDSDI